MDPEFIKALAQLAWPILTGLVLMVLLPILRRVVQSRGFSIKYGQMELSVQDASDQIRKQIEDLQNQVQALREAQNPTPKLRTNEQLDAAVPPSPKTILWVDDTPTGNAHEISKLQADGWEIITVTSTDAALKYLATRSTRPRVIISDMLRREGLTYHESAGLDLIREVRTKYGLGVPIFIYTASRIEDYREEVKKLGGNDITESPTELFRMVQSAA